MKKFLLLMSVFFLALNFTACSDDDEPNPEPEPEPQSENIFFLDGAKKTIDFAIFDKDDLGQNNYNLEFRTSDELILRVLVSGNLHDGKVIDLTKPETEHEGWDWIIDLIDKNKNYIFNTYGDPNVSSAYDFFSSGTLFVKRLADDAEGRPVFEVKIQNAKIKDDKKGDGKEHTVEFYWKGGLDYLA